MNLTKRDALRMVMKRYARAKTASKQAAIQAFVDEGMYTKGGKLTAEYGGRIMTKKSVAAEN